ncbi:MAG TPA: hypothetical protein VN281_05165, partial [Verrucomicrobiae bacterium]|nr:hypothetical protein [Verrucomicrobiae bacterium]
KPMILISIQFRCDAPECRTIKDLSVSIETASREINITLKEGWVRQGRKCYCPYHSGNVMGNPNPKQIE